MRERIEIEAKILAGYSRRRFVVVRTPRPKQPEGNYTYRYFLIGADDTLHEEQTESAIRRFLGIPPLTKFDRKYFNQIWDGVANAKAARTQYGKE